MRNFIDILDKDELHSVYEIYLNSIESGRNPINGRFVKGRVQNTKGQPGKTWDELGMSKANRKKCLKNLTGIGARGIGGQNAKRIVAIKNNELCFVFKSSEDAYRKTGINAGNIRQVCNGKRKSAGGYQWFNEDDNSWIELVNK